MVLFIATKEHEQELAYLDDLQIHVISEAQDMRQIFCRELRYLVTVSHIIIDENVIDEKTWEEAVQMLQEAKELPLLVVRNDRRIPDTYIRKDGYEILNQAHQDIKYMLLAWLEGREESLSSIWIAVAGLEHNAGATAMAMHLAAYIAGNNQNVTYTEYGMKSVLQIIAKAYDWEETEEGWLRNRIHFYHNQIDEEAEYTVFDLGVMDSRILPVWQRCPVKILVADGKPYRLNKLQEQLSMLADYPGKIYLVFNFVAESERMALRQRYESDKVWVWFAPFHPSLTDYRKEYRELLKEYVPEAEEERKKEGNSIKRLGKLGGIVGGSALMICLTILSGTAGIKLYKSLAATAYEPKEKPKVICEVEYPLMMQSAQVIQDRMTALSENDTGALKDTTGTSEEAATEAKTTEKEMVSKQQVTESTHVAPTTQATTEAETEASTEAATTAIPIPMRPSLRGYHGQIYTGSEVITIMSQYAGQEIAMHLQTRSSAGWYNYSITASGLTVASAVSSGIALIDPEVSFLCQVLCVNGEDLGLEFVQQ